MPVGLDLVLIPRKPEEPPLAEFDAHAADLVKQAARRLARRASGHDRQLLAALRNGVSAFLIGGVRCYQVCLRPIMPAVCRFQPSCSEYFISPSASMDPSAGRVAGRTESVAAMPFNRGGYDPP